MGKRGVARYELAKIGGLEASHRALVQFFRDFRDTKTRTFRITPCLRIEARRRHAVDHKCARIMMKMIFFLRKKLEFGRTTVLQQEMRWTTLYL